ncbi:MAG: signal peptidase I, partial [Clostridiales bacterium]|nr:signal peptidase I [Clostridiales bacterium]
VVSITIVFFAAIFIGTIISSEIFTIAEVSNISMQDTLVAGDKIYINKSAYWTKLPERGDIIVFLKGESLGGFFNKLKITTEDIYLRFAPQMRDNRLIKRVVGLPGDIIEIKSGEVYIDYMRLNESYTKGKTYPYRAEGKITIPEGAVFVMGDNREDSNDSRSFGFVELDSIEGRAVFRYWPFKRATVFGHSYLE